MVIVDKPMPTKCAGCWAMRCSKCIISDSKNIMEYQSNGTKPTWCPVKADVDKMVSKLDYEIQVTESMAGDDEWFKGKIYGIDSVISLLKDPTIKEFDTGYTGTCPKCRASILSGVEITKCWHCGTSVKLHKLDKKSEEYGMNSELYPGEFEAIERQGRLDAVIPEQKMMTSEEAIAILTREIDDDPFMRTEYRERIHEALKMGIKALEQTRWIPVSRKPPKEDEKVLTTIKWKDGSRYVDTDRCVDGKWMLNIPEDGDTTIAWMPLPKPYEPQESEVSE